MELKITIDKKPFGQYKVISQRAFQEDKVVIVEFPNCSFKWLPTYRQLDEIKKALEEVERINKTPLAQPIKYSEQAKAKEEL